MVMSYRVEGSYMPFKFIQLTITGVGEATLHYALYQEFAQPGQELEKTLTFAVKQDTLQELIALHQKADFFNVQLNDLNTDQVRVTDVGTTTLQYRIKDKDRTVSYGFVENNPLGDLVRLYGQIASAYLPKPERQR